MSKILTVEICDNGALMTANGGAMPMATGDTFKKVYSDEGILTALKQEIDSYRIEKKQEAGLMS